MVVVAGGQIAAPRTNVGVVPSGVENVGAGDTVEGGVCATATWGGVLTEAKAQAGCEINVIKGQI